tara:strand:- start:2898 stop:3134 length:237 start_codon:yes stop_codon:yes gene_type:complete
MRKILDALTILTFLLLSTTLVTAGIAYRYLRSENFKSQVMNQILSEVSGLLPNVLDKGLPDITGPSVPTTKIPDIPKL